MRKPKVIGSILLSILFWPLSLWGAGFQESQTAIAQPNIAPTQVDWLPQVESERLVLTVAGPGDLFIRREFESGQAPFLPISDPEWEHLPDGSYTWELRVIPHPNLLPQRSLVSSGHFSVKDGSFVTVRRKIPADSPRPPRLLTAETSSIDGDLAVIGEACIGASCTVDDADYPTLRLKASQPNILFDDVFVEGGSSPAHDWAVFINPSSAAEFSIADFTNSLIPFTIAGGAPNSSLYVADNGNLGLGTATPAKDIHAMSGNTPTLRLEQDGSGSLSPRTWDLGANQTELFVKDVTNSSSMPFRIRAGAPTSSIDIAASGNVGIGTASPSTKLHVSGSNGSTAFRVEETSGTEAIRTLAQWSNNGDVRVEWIDTSADGGTWGVNTISTDLRFIRKSFGNVLILNANGNASLAGTLTQGSSRELKTGFASLEPRDVLSRVTALPISLWSYKAESGVRHVGPMAEDFHRAFGLGADDKHLAPGDQAGIALAAIQGLSQVVQEKDAAMAQLEQTVESLRQQNRELAARLAALERLLAPRSE